MKSKEKQGKRKYKFKSEKTKQKIITICGIVLAIFVIFIFTYKGIVAYVSVDSEANTKNAMVTMKNCQLCADDDESCYDSCIFCEDEAVDSCIVDDYTDDQGYDDANDIESSENNDNNEQTGNDENYNFKIPALNDGENLTTSNQILEVLKNSKAIIVNKTVLGLLEGESFNLMVKTIPTASVTYKSINQNVATVSTNGQITGVSEGNTLISIKAGSSTVLVLVTVSKYGIPTKSVTLTTPIVYVSVGKQKIAFPVVLPLNTTDRVIYKSADESIATVDETGIITGVSKGKTTVSVTSGDKTKNVTVYCTTENSTKVLSIRKSIDIASGNEYQLKPIVLPTKSTDGITYTSDNNDVAMVDEAGKVTAVQKGKAIITVSSGVMDKTVTVNVKDENLARKIVVNRHSIKLGVGNEKQLKAIVLPLKSTNKITYVSTDPTIAEVNPTTGLIKAISLGETIITASAGDQMVKVNVTVLNNVSTKTLFLNKSIISIKKGNSWQIKATKYPSNSTDVVTYNSTKETVATVAQDGTITAVKRGVAIIKITSGKVKRTLTVIVK